MKSYLKYAPEALALLAGLALVFLLPGKIWNDAAQYQSLAHSILQGQFLIDGLTTMYREPGYPGFWAAIYSVTRSDMAVLWVQALLLPLVVYIYRRSWELITDSSSSLGAWGSLIAYGYWTYARSFGYEILTGLLLGLVVLFFCKLLRSDKWIYALWTGLSLGLLCITRGTFLFLGLFLVLFFVWNKGLKKSFQKQNILSMLVLVIATYVLPIGWMIRNQVQFKEFSLASRPGVVLYARALKTQYSLKQIEQSYLSVIIGQRLLASIDSDADPIVDQYYPKLWQDFAIVKARSKDPDIADSQIMVEAENKIFQRPTTFVKYILWTGIDEMRFLALPSPLYPSGSIEPIFRAEKSLNAFEVLALVCAMLLQLAWWICGLMGLYLGFKKYKKFFVLAIPVIYLILVHAPLDNVVRFSASIQPIIGILVLLALTAVFRRFKPKTLPNQ